MERDRIQVATSGSIDRHEACENCGEPMLYVCHPGSLVPVEMFCDNLDECCPEALLSKPVPPEAARG